MNKKLVTALTLQGVATQVNDLDIGLDIEFADPPQPTQQACRMILEGGKADSRELSSLLHYVVANLDI